MLVDVLKTPTRHMSLFHQLMVQMSIFDIIGSIAYAFTSLPIPSDYYLEGAKGTEATCRHKDSLSSLAQLLVTRMFLLLFTTTSSSKKAGVTHVSRKSDIGSSFALFWLGLYLHLLVRL